MSPPKMLSVCPMCLYGMEWFPFPEEETECPGCKVTYTQRHMLLLWSDQYRERLASIEKTLELRPEDLYLYRASVIRIIDGDTIEATVDLEFNISITEKFRFNDFDAGETTWRAENSVEKEHGNLATRFVTDLLLGNEVIIITRKSGKYGRWIADILIGGSMQSPVTLTDFMKTLGLSKLDSYV